MDEWGYGAMGNAGYDYAPGKNRLMNYNADYAGAIGNEYYMTVKDGEIVTDYWVTYYNFDDVNGNGEPDEEELTDDALTNCEGKVHIEGENDHEKTVFNPACRDRRACTVRYCSGCPERWRPGYRL